MRQTELKTCIVCGEIIPNSEDKPNVKYCENCRAEQKRENNRRRYYYLKVKPEKKFCQICNAPLTYPQIKYCEVCAVKYKTYGEDKIALNEQRKMKEDIKAEKKEKAAKRKEDKREEEKKEKKRLKFIKQCEGCGHFRPIAHGGEKVCNYCIDMSAARSLKNTAKNGKCIQYSTKKFIDPDCYRGFVSVKSKKFYS